VVHIFYGAEEALDFGGSFLFVRSRSRRSETTAPEVFGWSQLPATVTVEGHRSRESVLLRGSAWLRRSCLRRRGVAGFEIANMAGKAFDFGEVVEERKTRGFQRRAREGLR